MITIPTQGARVAGISQANGDGSCFVRAMP